MRVVLCGVGLRLSDLVQLYAELAQGAQAAALHILPENSGTAESRFMSSVAAWQVSDILSGIAPPKGAAAQADRKAYKTGTSYGHRDAWAIGFDGRHVIGVWLGRPDGTPVPGVSGGALATSVLFKAFGRISPFRVPLPLPPDGALILGTAHLSEQLRGYLLWMHRAEATVSKSDWTNP